MNFNAVLADYALRLRPLVQQEYAFYQKQPSLLAAIRVAGLALTAHYKRHPHQYRISASVLAIVHENLISRYDEIAVVRDFDSLFALVQSCRVRGFGELATYEAAVRLGAYLNVWPTKVYLHAGALVGARKLGLKIPASGTIAIEELPEALQELPAFDVEQILCRYKDVLADIDWQ